MAKRSSISKTAVWILMGLLILGLGGFGAVNLSGNLRSIGTVGDKSISVDAYARQLQNEIRAIERQSGQPLPFARAQEIGLDRAVLPARDAGAGRLQTSRGPVSKRPAACQQAQQHL